MPCEDYPHQLKTVNSHGDSILIFTLTNNGSVYTKQEALNHIAKTQKGSDEMCAMISLMAKEGLVLCKETCLYDRVQSVKVDHFPVGVTNGADGAALLMKMLQSIKLPQKKHQWEN